MKNEMKKKTKQSTSPDTARGEAVARELEKIYPHAPCALEWGGEEPWRLMVMGRLSARCRDARVNQVCRELFARFPTLDSMADADVGEIAEIIRPCGLYRTKAESVKAACVKLRDEFGGELPRDIDTLCSFPGVGRKIANLLLGDVFGIPGIVADTHCIKLGGRFGFYDESITDPVKVERILSGVIPPELQTDTCHRFVRFGDEVCRAQSPRCDICPEEIKKFCVSKYKKS